MGGSNETATTKAGKKIAAQFAARYYPGVPNEIDGNVVTIGGKTLNRYQINLRTSYDARKFRALSTEICKHLNDSSAYVTTYTATSGATPNRGVGGQCSHLLSQK
jgi:hypothetical protein